MTNLTPADLEALDRSSFRIVNGHIPRGRGCEVIRLPPQLIDVTGGTTDEDVLGYVVARAQEGSELHIRLLKELAMLGRMYAKRLEEFIPGQDTNLLAREKAWKASLAKGSMT